MNEPHGWSPELQRYLDGDEAHAVDESARVEADRFRDMVTRYAQTLEVPGADVDETVMATLRARAVPSARPSVWRRLAALASTPIRPTLAAATLAAVLVGVSAIGVAVRGSGDGTRVAKIEPLEIPVLFELDLPDAAQVNLAGDFNGWNAAATPLSKHPMTGRWVATLSLAPGWHEYLFVVDGVHWIPDPTAITKLVTGEGDTSSAIFVAPPP